MRAPGFAISGMPKLAKFRPEQQLADCDEHTNLMLSLLRCGDYGFP